MLKTLIKFKVLEVAIGVFFDKLYAGLGNKPRRSGYLLNEGEHLNQIDITYVDALEPDGETIYGCITYYDITVLKVTPISVYIEYSGYKATTFDHEGTLLDESSERHRDRTMITFDEIFDII